MVSSLENYLLAIEAHLPAVLVSPTAFSDIRAMARELPPSERALFECRLGKAAADADFCVWADEALDILAGRDASAKLKTAIVRSLPWQRLRTLLEGRRDSALLRQTKDIWLEFDRPASSGAILRPSVFCGMRGIKEDRRRVVESGLRLLRGGPLPAQLANALSLCFGALPTNARVFQVGIMFSRKNMPVRLCARGFARDQVPDYLLAIGWPGSMEDVDDVLNSISPHLHDLAVTFDLDGGIGSVGPRLGIECRVKPRYSLEDAHLLWEPFLTELVRLDLCLPSEREALLTWPGYEFHDVDLPSVFVRGLNHAKVVWEPPGFVYAKAYLAFVHSRRRSIAAVR